MSEKPKYWMGTVPDVCDLSTPEDLPGYHDPVDKVFVDGKTRIGPWANMCMKCHRRDGFGLGLGKGQKYEKQEDGKWLKTAG